MTNHLLYSYLSTRAAEEGLVLEQKSQRKGSILCSPDEICANLIYIIDGRIFSFSKSKGQSQPSIHEVHFKGELLNEMLLLDGKTGPYYASVASSTATIIEIPVHWLKKVMEDDPRIAFELQKLMLKRLKKLEYRVESLRFKDVKTRLVEYLLSYCPQNRLYSHALIIPQLPAHKEIAVLIGATRQTVTSILGELKDKRLLERRNNQIVIHKPYALKEMVNN